MKRSILIAGITLGALALASPVLRAQGVQMFEGTWDQVLAEAQRQNKPIYLDAYATWCGPCKMLKRDVFPDRQVGAYFNANYISVSVDMEKGEGIELAKKFGVTAYPTHLYFDPSGNLVHRAVGANKMPEFGKTFIQWAEDARDPGKQLYAQIKRYNAGERNADFLYQLALDASEAYMPEARAIAASYFATQSEADLLSDRNWEALGKLGAEIDSREFRAV